MSDNIISFLAGILVPFIVAYISFNLQKHHDKNKKKEEGTFQVYMMLLDIIVFYQRVVICEMNNQLPENELNHQLQKMSLKISDKIREYGEVEYMEDILEVLFSERFSSAWQREDHISKLIDKLSSRVHSKFHKKMKKIGMENMNIIRSKGMKSFNAPGTSKLPNIQS